MCVTPFLHKPPPDASGPHLSPLEAFSNESSVDFFQTGGNKGDAPWFHYGKEDPNMQNLNITICLLSFYLMISQLINLSETKILYQAIIISNR